MPELCKQKSAERHRFRTDPAPRQGVKMSCPRRQGNNMVVSIEGFFYYRSRKAKKKSIMKRIKSEPSLIFHDHFKST